MKIKLLVMDVDGTLTDGKIYIGPDGETMKAFYAQDGFGIVAARRAGVVPVIITGRRSEIVARRAEELGVTELYQGETDKLTRLRAVAAQYGASPAEIACIGDDLNDLPMLAYAGVTACPRDAAAEVREAVGFVCPRNGGAGAVRDFIDLLRREGRL